MPKLSKQMIRELKAGLAGDIKTSRRILKKYSTDAGLFKITPQAVIFPRNVADLSHLVKYVTSARSHERSLSLTPRSGGTDMSGGAINDSLIVDFGKYFRHIDRVKGRKLAAQPGAYYRNFEKVSLRGGLIMPAFPASREICMIGGIVANNAGGEKSLNQGKVEDYVAELKVILRDGNQYTLKPLNRAQLNKKMKQTNLEGQIYRQVFELIEKNYKTIKDSKPKVSKDSTGYHLYNVWDKKTFDLTQLISGSQGTLGLVTEATFRLVHAKAHSGLLIASVPHLDNLAEIIAEVRKAKPASFESFDDHTLKFAFRYFPYFRKTFGWFGLIKLGFQFLPDLRLFFKGFPKLILLIEFEGEEAHRVKKQIHSLAKKLSKFDVALKEAATKAESRKYWVLRRESFNILRKSVKSRHTAPFIDDFIINPKYLPEFLPRLREILEKYELFYTIAGHMGNGNFHIIPLMELQKKSERDKLEPVMREVNDLVLTYEGSLSAEHNDGMIRGPFLPQMYGPKMMAIFKEIKHIFDPHNIFNPHKKTDANWQFSKKHIRRRF